jgi:predicted RNA binding protein YcfA (HicA-like mRNA interferase family)
MALPPRRSLSGQECVKILCNRFGFRVVRIRGSHAILKRVGPEGTVGTVVPLHDDLRPWTLRSVLALAQVPWDEFQSLR